jgi:EAL and modified HD-GYP domain-containing signal transduction protein
MSVYVARKPIFDVHRRVFGYELDFKDGIEPFYHDLASDRPMTDLRATAEFADLAGGRRGLVTLTESMIADGVPSLLPTGSVILRLPDSAEPDERTLSTCRRIHDRGYAVCVDAKILPRINAPLREIADLVNVDLASTRQEHLAGLAGEIRHGGALPLGSNADDLERFRAACEAGFSYLQGRFYCRSARTSTEIPTNKINYIQLLQEINAPDHSYEQLEAVLKRDVGLTYKLLRFLNSAWFGLRYEVNSIRHALVLLGPREIKRWVSVLAVRDIGEDKTREMILRSLARAKTAEQIAPLAGCPDEAPSLFLVGMFSSLDVLLDTAMETALEDLPLNDDIRRTLLERSGPMGDILQLVLDYEQGHWEQLEEDLRRVPLRGNDLPGVVRRSLKWADEALNTI